MWLGSIPSIRYGSNRYPSDDSPFKKIGKVLLGAISGVASLALAGLGVHLGGKALMDAPFPALCFCATIVGGCIFWPFFLFLIPVALISIPMMIKSTGAALTLAAAFCCCKFSAEQFR